MVTVDTVGGSTWDKYKFYFSFKEESEKGKKYVEVKTRETTSNVDMAAGPFIPYGIGFKGRCRLWGEEGPFARSINSDVA